jgi:flagella basal body P-ring formation protein FlgA
MRRAKWKQVVATALLVVAAAGSLAHAQQQMVVVPTRIIYPGDVISPESLDEVPLRRKLRDPNAIVYRPKELTGKIARRTLLPGRLIPVGSVREAWLVERGATVQVEFRHGPLEITVSGVTLESGSAGDLIRLRNVDTGVVFTGIVMEDGSVRVSAS